LRTIAKIVKRWLPIAILATAMSGLAYGLAQQVLRQSANDPQVQMAEDAAAALAAGAAVSEVMPATQVDIGASLAPFLIIYNESGQILAASGALHGQRPVLPKGVLDYTRSRGEDRVTWQPEAAVRMAAVVVHYGGQNPGFVLAARSLREVEQRESNTLLLTLLALAATLAATLLAVVAGELLSLYASRHKSLSRPQD